MKHMNVDGTASSSETGPIMLVMPEDNSDYLPGWYAYYNDEGEFHGPFNTFDQAVSIFELHEQVIKDNTP